MADQRDPASDPELAALAKRDAEVAAALEAERRGKSGDFGGSLNDNWDRRLESDEGWDATALGYTIGQSVDVHLRDGTVYTGKVKATSDGRGWPRPVVEDGVVLFEDGTRITTDDIVSVSPVPDAEHGHDLGPTEGDDGPSA
jgi:hypothetical protein